MKLPWFVNKYSLKIRDPKDYNCSCYKTDPCNINLDTKNLEKSYVLSKISSCLVRNIV